MPRERKENGPPGEPLPDARLVEEAERYETLDAQRAARPYPGDGEGPADGTPEADAAEQRRPLLEPVDPGPGTRLPAEADPADAAEQDREIGAGDDDYR
ncbi:hypothetical protein [Streptomyces avicenniae]|uniref:hypothetical protein n=1 Tax=Streptomyces avicenniae TaxID=500153 RepID=UPI00069A668E|nr:hypothetical protein [Streptomyces avicenniae]